MDYLNHKDDLVKNGIMVAVSFLHFSFLKFLQLVFALFLLPNPPLKILFVAPNFSLLFLPFFYSYSLLSSQILYYRKMG